MIHPDVLATFVEENCTEKEREAIDLVWGQKLSIRRAAYQLKISTSTLRGRLDNVVRKLEKAGHDLD